MAIAGFVLGIAGIVLSFFGGYLSIVALPVSIVGLVLSVVAGKKQRTGLTTAGLVLGIIAVVLSAILFFTCGLCVLCAAVSVAIIARGYSDKDISA